MKSFRKESGLIFHQIWGERWFLSPFSFFSSTPFGAIFNRPKTKKLKFRFFLVFIYIEKQKMYFGKLYNEFCIRWHGLLYGRKYRVVTLIWPQERLTQFLVCVVPTWNDLSECVLRMFDIIIALDYRTIK